MRRVIAFGLFVAITAVTTAEEEKKKAALDPAKLVGSWQLTAGTKNGTKSSDDALKGVAKFTKDKISMGEGDMAFEFSYTLDTKVTPVAIDMEMTKGPMGVGTKAKGIISLEGDEMKLCYTIEDRPAKFDGEKAMLFVMKKKKD